MLPKLYKMIKLSSLFLIMYCYLFHTYSPTNILRCKACYNLLLLKDQDFKSGSVCYFSPYIVDYVQFYGAFVGLINLTNALYLNSYNISILKILVTLYSYFKFVLSFSRFCIVCNSNLYPNLKSL